MWPRSRCNAVPSSHVESEYIPSRRSPSDWRRRQTIPPTGRTVLVFHPSVARNIRLSIQSLEFDNHFPNVKYVLQRMYGGVENQVPLYEKIITADTDVQI